MWTKTILTWTDDSQSVVYNVSYIGANGTGSVNSVNAKGGDVILYGSDISMSDQNATKIDAEITALKNRVTDVATQLEIDALFA